MPEDPETLPIRSRAPRELWLFIVGYATYYAVSLMPQVGHIPANPIGLFAIVAAVGLIESRTKKSYWATTGFSLASVAYPLLVFSNWLQVTRPTLPQLWWVFVVPALLSSLMFTPGVRRFAQLRAADVSKDRSVAD